MQQLSVASPVEVLGWATVIVGLAGLAFLVRLDQQSKMRRRPAAPVARAHPVVVDRQAVMADVFTRVSGVAFLQSGAALQIDAAEHTLQQLIAECRGVNGLPPEWEYSHAEQRPHKPTASKQSLAA